MAKKSNTKTAILNILYDHKGQFVPQKQILKEALGDACWAYSVSWGVDTFKKLLSDGLMIKENRVGIQISQAGIDLIENTPDWDRNDKVINHKKSDFLKHADMFNIWYKIDELIKFAESKGDTVYISNDFGEETRIYSSEDIKNHPAAAYRQDAMRFYFINHHDSVDFIAEEHCGIPSYDVWIYDLGLSSDKRPSIFTDHDAAKAFEKKLATL